MSKQPQYEFKATTFGYSKTKIREGRILDDAVRLKLNAAVKAFQKLGQKPTNRRGKFRAKKETIKEIKRASLQTGLSTHQLVRAVLHLYKHETTIKTYTCSYCQHAHELKPAHLKKQVKCDNCGKPFQPLEV